MSGAGERRVLVVALSVLTIVVVLFFLRTARDLLVPIALAVLASYALEPVVGWLERHRVPRLAGAPLVVLALLVSTTAAFYLLIDDVVQVIETLPAAARRARQLVTEHIGRSAGAVKEAAEELGTTTGESASSAGLIDSGGVLEGVVSATLQAAGDAIVIVFLVLFLLIARNGMRSRVIEMAGSDVSRRRVTSKVIDEIESQIQRFLLVLVFTGVLVGASTWAALLWLGVRHAAIWGILAGVFNSIPYFGPAITSVGLLVVGLVQEGDLTQALLMAAMATLITSLEGWLLTPVLMGKAENMNALTVFIGLMLWTWLWGAWGTILAVPMLVVVKATADHVPALHRVGRLMAA